jgi:transposase
MPQRRTIQTIADFSGVQMSQGTLNAILAQAHERLSATEDAVKALLKTASVAHADETGMYVGGKRLWEHNISTQLCTLYFCHPKRGGQALRDAGVLDHFGGRLVHDAWAPYFKWNILHGLCNAHHLRELVFVKEQLRQRWAGTMAKHLCRIKHTVERAKMAQRTSLATTTLQRYRTTYEKIIACGYRANPHHPGPRVPGKRGRTKQPPARNLLDRLGNRADQALAFMYDFNVPFDNNLAERDLRMTKVKQKVSGCFRSMAGAQIFCRIGGCISTVRKHGINVLDSLYACFDPTDTREVLIET